jgi:hypothetical protein
MTGYSSAVLAIGLLAEGQDCCLGAVLQAEFGDDAADVGLDGLLADRQVPGDLPGQQLRAEAGGASGGITDSGHARAVGPAGPLAATLRPPAPFGLGYADRSEYLR